MNALKYLKSRKFITTLKNTIKGYHLASQLPVKEACWEGILASALAHEKIDRVWHPGGHQSGQDIMIGKEGLSCKTCKDFTNHIDISSYRMTKCSNIKEFIDEIDYKRANFKYYIILARTETSKAYKYTLYAIPANLIKAKRKTWTEIKTNKKISSWKTDTKYGYQMRIQSSLSNQLWIKINKKNFKRYIIFQNLQIAKEQILDYASLYKMWEEKNSSTQTLFT